VKLHLSCIGSIFMFAAYVTVIVFAALHLVAALLHR
jgi:hypothetical protein